MLRHPALFLLPCSINILHSFVVLCVWNVMAHAQKPGFVFRRNGRVHLNRWGRQFSRLLTAELCASAVVMLDTPCSEVVWRVLATQSIRQFPLHFPSRAWPCVITFQLNSTLFGGPVGCISPVFNRPPLQLAKTWFVYLFLHFRVLRHLGNQRHRNHHHICFIELGHLLTRSGLTYPEVSSKVYHDSFCQVGSSIMGSDA